MLEWLKEILGEKYSEEIDTRVSAEIGKNFVAKADFNNVKSELKTARESILDRDGQLETLKQSTGDVEVLRRQIADLQAENADKEKQHAAEIRNMRRENIDNTLLSAARAKNQKAVKAILDDAPEDLDDEAYRTLRAEQIKKLVDAQETAFLFDSEVKPKVKLSGAVPAGGGGVSPEGGMKPQSLAQAVQAALFANEE